MANSLWSQVGAPLEAEFLELIAERYGGIMHAVDFHNACDAARAEINRWVEERTRQRIRELIPPGGLAVDTRLVLASAVYFKGLWSLQFDQSRTRDKRFYTEGGRRVRVPLMRKRAKFRYVAASGYQAVDLDYQGSDLAMLVLLPDRRDGLHDLEKALSARLLADCLAQMASCEVELLLPRFRLTWGTVDLIRHLRAIGIELPFTDRADFAGINGHSPPDLEALFISQVLHKAFVEVNEEGTEAAAATALNMVLTSALYPQFPQPVPVFRADHPFLFAIHDRETGEILFLGRLGDPTEEHCS